MEQTNFKLGDIISYSWGYDQTNVDFFEVVRVSASSVWIRQRNSSVIETGNMSGEAKPASGFASEEVLRKKIQIFNGRPILSMKHGIGNLWSGESLRTSWYA